MGILNSMRSYLIVIVISISLILIISYVELFFFHLPLGHLYVFFGKVSV